MNLLENLSPVIQTILATTFTFLITAFGSALVFFFKKPPLERTSAVSSFHKNIFMLYY